MIKFDPMPFAVYWRWLDRKLGKKNGPAERLQRRTMNTAVTILSLIAGIPFEHLSGSLYFICEDVAMEAFAHQYEAQLELAGAAPERFAKGLHKFYNDMARRVKEEGLYADFFDFVSQCGSLRLQWNADKIDTTVVDCYVSFLLQQLEYLKPDKFNLHVRICGLTTEGEIMLIPDDHPNLDLPGYEIDAALRANQIHSEEQLLALVQKAYAKIGYDDVRTLEDTEIYAQMDRVLSSQLAIMLPFINEYTFDMVPARTYSASILPLLPFDCGGVSAEALVERLRHRSRTLPPNGVQFEIRNQPVITGVRMKECLYDEAIHMIYKLSLTCGDLFGYYNTKTGFLYTVLLDARSQDTHMVETIRTLLLYLYAGAVTKEGTELLAAFPRHFQYIHPAFLWNQMEVELFQRGGKPARLYRAGPSADRKDDEKYESVERELAGFIRKVGPGKTPSAEAVAYAASLGFSLAPDETYVRPFTKHVLRLRRK